MKRFTLLSSALFVCSLLGVPVSQADGSNGSSIQLVQSVPVETDLSQPGLPNTAEVWINMIKGAKSTLEIAQFYISSHSKSTHEKKEKGSEDHPLEPVIEELERAGKRGVRIRFLLSSTLLKEDPQTLARIKRIRNASVRIFDMSRLTGGVHHAKYWIADGKEIFVGSQNFDWRSLNQIVELGVRVQDVSIAHQLLHLFEIDWKAAKTQEIPVPKSASAVPAIPPSVRRVELVASPESLNGSETRPAIQALLELINGAHKSIRVQLLDYSPVSGSQVYWSELDNALRAAALRGVKIQMLVANGSSTLRAIDYLKSLAMLPGVEIKMASLPQYSGGFIPYARVIHSKYMIIDEEIFWIGTSNWSKGYFYNSRNIELLFRQAELAQTGLQIFQRLWNYPYSEKVDPNKAYSLR